jgi:hypothetical protein
LAKVEPGFCPPSIIFKKTQKKVAMNGIPGSFGAVGPRKEFIEG